MSFTLFFLFLSMFLVNIFFNAPSYCRSQLTGESVSCVWPLSCCPWSAVLYSVYLPVFRSQLPGEPVSCVWPLLCCSWSALYCISTCLDPSYLVSRSAESDLYHAAHYQLYCISTSLDPSYLVSRSAVSDLYHAAHDQLYIHLEDVFVTGSTGHRHVTLILTAYFCLWATKFPQGWHYSSTT